MPQLSPPRLTQVQYCTNLGGHSCNRELIFTRPIHFHALQVICLSDQVVLLFLRTKHPQLHLCVLLWQLKKYKIHMFCFNGLFSASSSIKHKHTGWKMELEFGITEN